MVTTIFRIGIASIVTAGFVVLLYAGTAGAIGESGVAGGVSSARGVGVPTNLADGDGSLVARIINIMLYAIGVISVVMLIFGGFRYVVSGGDSGKVTAAKNTILYAIVGLLIAIFAYAIVTFVVGAAIGGGNTTDI